MRYSAPERRGEWYFFLRNDGLQPQPVLYRQRGLEGSPEAVLDPGSFSSDGTVAMVSHAISRNGRLLAYGLSACGSDWQEIRVRDIDRGLDSAETLRWTKFSSIAWMPDGSGFFYTAFPQPGTVPAGEQYDRPRLCWHRVGTPQDLDTLVYEQDRASGLNFGADITDDGRYLVLTIRQGTDPHNRVYYRELGSEGPFVRLLDKGDAHFEFIGNKGTVFYFYTDSQAPRGRIIAVDSAGPAGAWQEVIAEETDAIADAVMADGQILVSRLHDAYYRVSVYRVNGVHEKDLPVPPFSGVTVFRPQAGDEEVFLGLVSFLHPPSMWRYEINTGRFEPWRQPDLRFDPQEFRVEQDFFCSKDGTRVPMFLMYRKGLQRDGANPVLLYGYGGFNAASTPDFNPSRVLWAENGGVFALVNLRGGSEYGEAWHRAGMLEQKQNVFDDFIAAAEHLISTGFTCPRKLAIMGRSNGGLLVAACLVQRPDLFGAAVCNVPVTDMLRYHLFTVGRYWVCEYGDPANPGHFPFLISYSPVHNVRPGTSYPPVIIGTAESDDRVFPAHAYKFAAALRDAQAGDSPVLLRVEAKAGHGFGKPTAKVIDEESDFQAFLCKTLEVKAKW